MDRKVWMDVRGELTFRPVPVLVEHVPKIKGGEVRGALEGETPKLAAGRNKSRYNGRRGDEHSANLCKEELMGL
jgi:hypothetical protein